MLKTELMQTGVRVGRRVDAEHGKDRLIHPFKHVAIDRGADAG